MAASKTLELILELVVKGSGDAKQLEGAIDQLKKKLKDLDGIKTLDEMFNAKSAKASFAAINDALSKLDLELKKGGASARSFFDLIAQVGKQPLDIDVSKINKNLDLLTAKTKGILDLIVKTGKTPVDFDISKASKELDLLLGKEKQMVDLLLQAGKTPVNLNTSQANRNLDLVVSKTKGLFDLVAARGKTPIDFNLKKVESEAKQVTAAFAQMLAQLKKTTGGGGIGAGFDKLNSSIRDSASSLLFFRRVLLGLGFVGVGSNILDVAKSFDQMRASMQAVFGDNASEEFIFIQKQAERLGLDISALSKEYTKFASAANALGLSQQVVKDNFLAVAEAGAKLGLSSEEVAGALTAVQQIASKGRLSMEELRQQLGDRLPGAVAIAAKALGVTQAKLFALVEQGKISSEVFLTKFPAALRASFGTDASTRILTTSANIERFKNALKELTDTALRSGTLDAATKALQSFTNTLRSPETVQNLQKLSEQFGGLITFVAKNIGVFVKLGEAFLAFKAAGAVVGVFKGIGDSLSFISKNAAPVVAAFGRISATFAGIPAATSALSLFTSGVAAAATGIVSLGGVIGRVLLALGSLPAAAAIAAAGLGLAFKSILDSSSAAKDAALELADAQRTLASNQVLETWFDMVIERYSEFADTVILSQKEVESLTEANTVYYAQAIEGAIKLKEAEARQAIARIEQIKAQIVLEKQTGQALKDSEEAITHLKEVYDLATASVAAYTAELTVIDDATAKTGKTSSEFVAHLRDVADQINKVTGATQKLDPLILRFEQLDKEAKGAVDQFKQLRSAGENVAKVIEKMLPKDLLADDAKSLQSIASAFLFLEQTGQATAKVITDELAKAFDKLNAAELRTLQTRAVGVFEQTKQGAAELALVLEGTLKAALKNMGVDIETVGTKVSKNFAEFARGFETIAENAKVTGAQLKAALDIGLSTAKSREELLLLKDTIEKTGIAGGKFADDLADSLTRLDDAIRLTTGQMDSALGDSFKRLGITATESLKAIGDQAVIDFKRVKDSGLASALELEAAFRKMAEEITKATKDGIPPIQLRFAAIDNNAFDILVRTAELASERVKKAIESAIPLADTLEKLRVLREGIIESFDKGKLAVDDFGKLVTEVGFKIREMAAKPVGELAAAADLLGLKTKDQLKAISDNAKEAFSTIASSGQFTNAELAKGAQQFLDAYMAANQGVVDSFDPVVAKALEVVGSIDGVTEAIDKMKNKASEPIDVGSLKDKTLVELQQQLQDTVKAYRAIGVQNVQDLQIVQAIQKELNDRGAKDAADRKSAMDTFTQKQDQFFQQVGGSVPTGAPPALTPGGRIPGLTPQGAGAAGAPIVNIHIDSSATTLPSTLRRTIIPLIKDRALRSR